MANFKHASISSVTSEGYCFRISSLVSPALKNSKMVCTVILLPLIAGFPLQTYASTVILLIKVSIIGNIKFKNIEINRIIQLTLITI